MPTLQARYLEPARPAAERVNDDVSSVWHPLGVLNLARGQRHGKMLLPEGPRVLCPYLRVVPSVPLS